MKTNHLLLLQKRKGEIKVSYSTKLLLSIFLTIFSIFSLFYIPLKYSENKTFRVKWALVAIASIGVNFAVNASLEETEKELINIKRLDREQSKLMSGLTLYEMENEYNISEKETEKTGNDDPFVEMLGKMIETATVKDAQVNPPLPQGNPQETMETVTPQVFSSIPSQMGNREETIDFSDSFALLATEKRENKPVGESIIDEASATTLSTVFAAPPGSGKSYAMLAWLKAMFEKFPMALVKVIARKNDSFAGLREVEAVTQFEDEFTVISALNEIALILENRCKQPEDKRAVFKKHPIILILDDWFSIYSQLASNPTWKNIASQLSYIITVGRELNVSIVCGTHSFNLASLGLAKDGNIRNCLNIMAMGFISQNSYGSNQGNFNAISSIINNRSIIPAQYKQQLESDLESLIPLSKQTKTPIIFTTMGEPPRLGLMPNLEGIKDYRLPESVLDSVYNQIRMIKGQVQTEITDSDNIYQCVENEEMAQKVLELVDQGIGKTDIIRIVWGATSGRSYQKACQQYAEIIGE
jgi:hypothetical protein